MTIRFAHLVRPVLFSATTALAVLLSGCPGSSTPPPDGVDSGPSGTDAGPRLDAPSGDTGGAVDSGPSDVDGGPVAIDAGPAATDAGPTTSDAGTTDTDAGGGATDAGPAATDAGPPAPDAGGAVDAGSPPGSCSPACGSTDYCDLCASVPMCVLRPADEGRICPAIYDPVCGCDGMTYSNSCALASAMMGLLHAGECAAPPGDCVDDGDCAPGDYCATCRGPSGPVTVCLTIGTVC